MMMEQLRRSTKWIMILVALAFGGLMFFEWGMDITGQTSGSFGEIGRVNGAPVSYEQYMASYRSLYDQAQQLQEEPITSVQNTGIEDQAWDEIVNAILVQQELERRAILVTDDEVRAAALASPPPQFMSNPAFETDGFFDITKYQQFIATADNLLQLQLEAYYRDVIPRGKLLRQVSSGIHLSDAELWSSYRDQNERASVSYVSFDPFSRVADDRIEITDAEVSRYYDDNRDEFLTPASARVVSVALRKTPTAADTAAVLARADELRQSIQDGDEEFAAAAERESSDEATAVNGGNLGVFAQGRMVAPFDSAVFAAPPGSLTEPVRTSFGVHLIEVLDRWGQDSAQARHILLPFERTDDSEIELLSAADSLEELGESMSLSDAAAMLGLEADTIDVIETGPLIVGAGAIAEGGEWLFEDETQIGDVSPVFENASAFYAIEMLSLDPARHLSQDEAEAAIRSTISVQKKLAVAVDEAREVADEVLGGRALADVALEFGLELRDAGPFARTEFAPGLGMLNAATGTAFGLDVGEVSGAVEANGNAFVIEKTGFEAADSLAWLEQVDEQRAAAVNAIRQQRLDQWIEALRAMADIVDRREQVLTPPDEQDRLPLPPMF